ncbi:magnesium transporter CorA family protein [Heyndrickxia coagulans]|uniref:magnesium transporter CorA family protein n=1 Tax=Heyndrickxia coagulans TaxID=1398 RepID=UPI002E1A22B1|nr:magnesium transporter CorA family protein [Heyndrickxia coagulans]
MLHLYKNKENNWKWYQLESVGEKEIARIIDENEECKTWIENIKNDDTNTLTIDTDQNDRPFVEGSLIFDQHTINREEHDMFHFYITEQTLLTVDLDFSKLKNTEIEKVIGQMAYSRNAIEAFFIIIGAIVNNYLDKIDEFEIKLNELIWEIQKRNDIDTLDKIYERRHELLVCRNLMVPVKEILYGMQEGFGTDILEYPQVQQRVMKIERCLALLQDYQQEIDTLLNVEEVVSGHRGNSIMKTLTVLTTLFTPISAWSALWGMNFKNMPELSWRYGYIAALGLIVVNTILLYIYLYRKGWTGDILKGNEKKSLFK